MELDLWTQSLVTAMTALWTKVANFIPNLFGALVLVLLGFVVAKLLDTLLSKLLAKLGLDRLMAGTGLTKLLGRAGLQVPISTLIGKIAAEANVGSALLVSDRRWSIQADALASGSRRNPALPKLARITTAALARSARDGSGPAPPKRAARRHRCTACWRKRACRPSTWS